MFSFAVAGARVLPLVALALVVAPFALASAQQPRAIQPQLTQLFSSDSLDMTDPVLSPDGRWIVFGTYEARRGNLWTVPAAGGVPTRLTTGQYNDAKPVFFPGGDRIAFLSDRSSAPGNPTSYVMVMPFDPRTGRGEAPRQVTLEEVAGPLAPAISPDGQWIAYTVRADTIRRLMVVPSTGGSARMMAEFGEAVFSVWHTVWSGDGRYVYFTVRPRRRDAPSRIMRVPFAGGPPEELGAAPVGMLPRALFPDRGLMLLQQRLASPAEIPHYVIATLAGEPVASFTTPRYSLSGLERLTADGHSLLAARSNGVAPVRVVPVAGGPWRQLTEGREYDWPIGWTPDGSHVYVSTRSNGQEELLRLPVSGGPATRWAVSLTRMAGVSPDGRYAIQLKRSPRGWWSTLELASLQDGRTRVVTDSAYDVWASGPGGFANGAEILYLERRGDRLELRSTAPEGPSRLLRAFPAIYAGRTSFAVHGGRVAWVEPQGDSTALFVADGPAGRARQVVKIAGSSTQPVWSHDGRWLATDRYLPPGSPMDVVVVGIRPDGSLAAPPRTLESGAQWGWQIQWLPDDRALTVFGMTAAANENHVFLVSLRGDERPVRITRDDPAIRWGYSLSPDGRHVAYPAEISRGSSIWRVDLGDVLAAGAVNRTSEARQDVGNAGAGQPVLRYRMLLRTGRRIEGAGGRLLPDRLAVPGSDTAVPFASIRSLSVATGNKAGEYAFKGAAIGAGSFLAVLAASALVVAVTPDVEDGTAVWTDRLYETPLLVTIAGLFVGGSAAGGAIIGAKTPRWRVIPLRTQGGVVVARTPGSLQPASRSLTFPTCCEARP